VTVIDGVRTMAGAIRSPAIARWLRVVGPAWVVMLADVDAPSVITAGQGGTVAGYACCSRYSPSCLSCSSSGDDRRLRLRPARARRAGPGPLRAALAAVSVVGMTVINFVAYVRSSPASRWGGDLAFRRRCLIGALVCTLARS